MKDLNSPKLEIEHPPIVINIYWYVSDEGKMILDEDEIREEFEFKLQQVKDLI
tara:strand:- start:894 stop:1052 length:159 start_codon:yes stop_codon:yes gene_type:complete